MPYRKPEDYRAYQNAYHRRFLRRRRVAVGDILCPKCARWGELFEVRRVNLKTGRVTENGWEIRHGCRRCGTARVCILASNIRLPLSAIRPLGG